MWGVVPKAIALIWLQTEEEGGQQKMLEGYSWVLHFQLCAVFSFELWQLCGCGFQSEALETHRATFLKHPASCSQHPAVWNNK